MKILIVNDYVRYMGGAERVVANLISYLRRKNNKITLIGFDSGEKDNYIDKNSINIKENNHKLIRLFGRVFFSLSLYRKIRRAIKEINPDVIDIHLDYKYPLTTLFAVRGYPCIKTIHDFGFLCLESNGISDDGKHACLDGVSINCLLNRSVSFRKFLALYISQKIFKIIEKKQMKVIIAMNKIIYHILIKNKYRNVFYLSNTTSIDYTKNRVSKKCHKKLNKATNICYLGSLDSHKGVDLLIKALVIVKKEAPVKLRIISKDKSSFLTKMSNLLQLRENVEFLTKVSYNTVLTELKKSDILVLPSVCMENSPLVILEAMALGIPVIASKIGGIPDLVIDNKTGYLFKPRDVQDLAAKILKLAKNPNLSEKMGNYSKEIYYSKYQPKTHYYKLMNIYKFAFSLKR